MRSEPLSGLRRLAGRVAMIAARGIVRATDGARRLRATVELLAGETRRVELLQPFGLAYRPPVGSEIVFLSIGAARDNGVAIVAHDKNQGPTDLEEGEVEIYNLDRTATVRLRLDGRIRVLAAASIEVQAPSLSLTGNVQVSGSVTVTGNVSDAAGTMAEMRAFYNAHNHPSGGVPAPQMT